MNRKYLSLVLGACALCTAAATSFGAPRASVESRVAAQDSLFEDYYQAELKAHPERATGFGDYRYNDRLDDYSLAGIADQQARDQSYFERLEAISTKGLPGQDVLSHEVLRFTLRQRMENHAFKEYEMPVSQMDGPHVRLADLPLAVPFDTVKQYEDYVARLHAIPRVFTQTQEVLRAGLQHNLMPVRFLIDKVPEQCKGIIDADPFLLPTRKFPASISPEDQQRLARAITDAVNNEVLPAYRAFAAFIIAEYAPHGRTVLSAASLPGGERRYLSRLQLCTALADRRRSHCLSRRHSGIPRHHMQPSVAQQMVCSAPPARTSSEPLHLAQGSAPIGGVGLLRGGDGSARLWGFITARGR